MYDALKAAAFRDALNRIISVPQRTLRDESHVRPLVTMTSREAIYCEALATKQDSVTLVYNNELLRTPLILESANQTWKQNKIPAIAICNAERDAQSLQESTGIECTAAKSFFSDLKLSRPVTQTFSGSKNFVIGHDHNPHGRFDKIVLPSGVNLIVHDAERFSADQLIRLCDHVATVRGRLILSADSRKFEQAHPEISHVLNESEGVRKLRNDFDPNSIDHHEHSPTNATPPWVVVASSPYEADVSYVRSIHSSRDEALSAVPSVFADEWEDQKSLLQESWPDSFDLPTVSPAMWHALAPPNLGQRVKVENHRVVATIAPNELLPLRESLKEDSPAHDPLANAKPFLVFHAKNSNAHSFPDDFTLVAKVYAADIDTAVRLSQNGQRSWTQNIGVTPFNDAPRSTEVGDVIVDHDIPKRFLGSAKWERANVVPHPTPAADITPIQEPVRHRYVQKQTL